MSQKKETKEKEKENNSSIDLIINSCNNQCDDS